MSNLCLDTENLSVKSLKKALATQESNFHMHMKYKEWGHEDYSGKLEATAVVRPLILRSAYCWAALTWSRSCVSHTALPLRRLVVGKSMEKDTADPKWPDGCPVASYSAITARKKKEGHSDLQHLSSSWVNVVCDGALLPWTWLNIHHREY